MKVFKKIVLSFVLVLAICLPVVLMTACGGEKPLSLTQAFKTEYYVGEELDVSGGIIKYVDDGGNTTNVAVTQSMITAFTTEKPGNRKMIITYKDETITVDYSVKACDVQDNVYYVSNTGADATLYTFLIFNKSAGTVSISNATKKDPSVLNPQVATTLNLTKNVDEDGFISYSAVVNGVTTNPEVPTSTIYFYNITKNSLKMRSSAGGPEVTVTIYQQN